MNEQTILLDLGTFSGLGYGNHDDASFTIDQLITLDQGNNSLEILSMMIGLQVCYVVILQ